MKAKGPRYSPPDESHLIGALEAAALLGLSYSAFYRANRLGWLPPPIPSTTKRLATMYWHRDLITAYALQMRYITTASGRISPELLRRKRRFLGQFNLKCLQRRKSDTAYKNPVDD